MGRKHEYFRTADGSPFPLSAHHPRPSDAIRNPQTMGLFHQLRLPAHLVWSRYQEMPRWVMCHRPSESFDQQIATHLGVNSPQEYRDPLASKIWKLIEKNLCGRLQ